MKKALVVAKLVARLVTRLSLARLTSYCGPNGCQGLLHGPCCGAWALINMTLAKARVLSGQPTCITVLVSRAGNMCADDHAHAMLVHKPCMLIGRAHRSCMSIGYECGPCVRIG